MAGKRYWLGRVYNSGKALSEPLREEIIEMYIEGFSLTDISNDVKVTVRGVNKIINRHGGGESDVVTDNVCIVLKYGSFRGLAFMQEKYRTDFCLKGYVTEINFHQYR